MVIICQTSTLTGAEAAVSRLLRAATEACPRPTILSGLLMPYRRVRPCCTWRDARSPARSTRAPPLLPFAGEQGDPLMPAFYALAQHDALCDLQHHLRDGEAVFAFLDDVYIVALPERVRALYDALSAALWERARIRLHEGKTRIWNAAGEDPPAIADLGGSATVNQGLTVLGSPLGPSIPEQARRARALSAAHSSPPPR
eukprot:s7562_g2.t1